jgi:ribonuclease HII
LNNLATEFQSPSFDLEAEFCTDNVRFIAGIDEAGRGALAGPLGVALVIYDMSLFEKNYPAELKIINDSKKMSAKLRSQALQIIKDNSLVSLFATASPEQIDRTNINIATAEVIKTLIAQSAIKPDLLLLDGNFKFDLGVRCLSIKKGDQKSISIASASIVAKVMRDQIMSGLAEKYPAYDLGAHKGYGTLRHRKAIHTHGGSEIHRKSYEPLKSLLLNQ